MLVIIKISTTYHTYKHNKARVENKGSKKRMIRKVEIVNTRLNKVAANDTFSCSTPRYITQVTNNGHVRNASCLSS